MSAKNVDNVMHMIKWTILLSVFWILLSGYFQPLLLGFGVVSVALVVLVLSRMDALDRQSQQLGTGIKSTRYLTWLIGQIFSSSVHVTKLIWGPSRELTPTVAKISAKNVPKDSRVLYANSITLTPGTLSLDLEGDEITVHALQAESIDELKEGGMERKITSLWKEQNKEGDK